MTDQAYEILRERIGTGYYKLNQKLTEHGIADDLNLSATPIREAFNRLVTEGFLDSQPYKGVFVRAYSLSEVRQAYMVRGRLQGLSINLMMSKVTPDEIEYLNKLLVEELNKKDISIFMRVKAFQEQLFNISKSDVLARSLAPISAIISIERLLNISKEPDEVFIEQEFLKLMKCIRENQVEEAVNTIEGFILYVMEFVSENFDEFMC